MRLVLLSDTHGHHGELDVPDGDVLIHAGDFTTVGRRSEVETFLAWLASRPHARKVLVAGNHDFLFEREPKVARGMVEAAGGIDYLEDSGIEIDGVSFWGSPWQPRFKEWAFNLDRGEPLRAKWNVIPSGVDVLVTHSPPQGILDRTFQGLPVGCEELLAALARVKPRVHVFGHIHEGYGGVEKGGTRYVNACNCDVRYRAVNEPVVVEI